MHDTAIAHGYLTGDPSRKIGTVKDTSISDIGGQTQTGNRCAGAEAFPPAGDIFIKRGSVHQSGCNAVDANSVFTQFYRKAAGSHGKTGLGSTICYTICQRTVAIDGNDIDDVAAVPLTNHLLGACLTAEESTFEVAVHHIVPIPLLCTPVPSGAGKYRHC